jgi:hypothetical protein
VPPKEPTYFIAHPCFLWKDEGIVDDKETKDQQTLCIEPWRPGRLLTNRPLASSVGYQHHSCR